MVKIMRIARQIGKLAFLSLMALLFMWASETAALAQYSLGPVQVTGFYRDTLYLGTDHKNPNNLNLVRNGRKPDILLGQQFIDLALYWPVDEHWSLFFEPRLYHNFTDPLESGFSHTFRAYDAFPRQFAGNGLLARVGSREFMAEADQAYVDYRNGPLWIRAGKQSIAWGEAIGVQILDIVEPLDISRQLFIDRAFEEFDSYRIPEWFIRTNYTIPLPQISVPDFTVELLVNPGQTVPAILPEQGSPFNLVTSIVKFRQKVRQGQPTAGARLFGTFKDKYEFALYALSFPDAGGAALAKGLLSDPRGFPLLGPGAGLFRVNLENRHPRSNMLGWSLSFPIEPLGAFIRFENANRVDQPLVKFNRIVRRARTQFFFEIDRPVYWIPKENALGITFNFTEQYTWGSKHDVKEIGSSLDPTRQTAVLFLQQPLFNSRISLEDLNLYNTDGDFWIQPGVEWSYGNHQKVDVFYNHFAGSGAEKRQGGSIAGLTFARGVFFRYTWGL